MAVYSELRFAATRRVFFMSCDLIIILIFFCQNIFGYLQHGFFSLTDTFDVFLAILFGHDHM